MFRGFASASYGHYYLLSWGGHCVVQLCLKLRLERVKEGGGAFLLPFCF
jgi:hypothetical protein